MNIKSKIMIIILMSLFLVGCGKNDEEPKTYVWKTDEKCAITGCQNEIYKDGLCQIHHKSIFEDNMNEVQEESKMTSVPIEVTDEVVQEENKATPTDVPKMYVPNVSGTDVESAKQILLNKSLIPIIEFEYSETVEKDIVISTNPVSGAEIKADERVTIFVSKGPEIKETQEDNLKENEKKLSLSDFLSDQSINDDRFYDYIIFGSDVAYVTEDDLYGLTEEECKLARNEIYARYGRRFKTDSIQNYFDHCEWYYGYVDADDFNDGILSECEKININFIKKYEEEELYKVYGSYPRRHCEKMVCFNMGGGYFYGTIYLKFSDKNTGLMYIYISDENSMDTIKFSLGFNISDDMTIIMFDETANNVVRTGQIVDGYSEERHYYKLEFDSLGWGNILDSYGWDEYYETSYYFNAVWG